MDEWTRTVLYTVVGVLMATGLAGAVVPFVPGAPLILVAALAYAYATGFATLGWGRLLILGALTAIAVGLEYVAGAIGTRRFGGSRWAVVGALAGGVLGMAFGPLGLLLGPVAGAVIGELLRGAQLETGVRSGVGTVLGLLAGAVAKFAIALAMIGLFLWWVWRG